MWSPRLLQQIVLLLVFMSAIKTQWDGFANPFIRSTIFLDNLKENSATGARVADIKSSKRTFQCSIESNDFRLEMGNEPNQFFIISSRTFDREETSEIRVKLECSDEGERDRTYVLMIRLPIGDMNDNSPVFPRPFYSFSLPENNDRDTVIGRIAAMDRDAGDNARIR